MNCSTASIPAKKLDSLTVRQRAVVAQVASGKDIQQIADELNISVLTVKNHHAIFQRLNIHHRTALAARWHTAAHSTNTPERWEG